MYVCICKGVTEKTIQEAAKSGVNDYKSLRDKTGVASQCGKCGSDAKNCLRQQKDKKGQMKNKKLEKQQENLNMKNKN